MKAWTAHRAFSVVFVAAFAAAAMPAFSAPVDAAAAAKRAAEWRERAHPRPLAEKAAVPGRENTAPGAKTAVSGLAEDGTALFHSVVFDDGWWAVSPADDSLPPVLAFSSGGKPPAGPGSPAWETVARIAAARNPAAAEKAGSAAEKAAAEKAAGGTKAAGEGDVFDVRVPVLCETRWGQDRTGGATGRNCYNYYTPNNWPSGCIATALAQVMRHWRYPEGELDQVSEKCTVGGVETTMQFMEGPFDWDSMVPVPADGVSTRERRAIGKLLYDAGVACCMDWEPDTSTSSMWDMWWGLLYDFRYANAVFYGVYWNYSAPNPVPASIPSGDLSTVLRSNLDAGCPVVVGIDAHAAVADGYGYSGGALYTHLNFGWEGEGDGWFVLPDVDCGFYASSYADQVVYNVFPALDERFANGAELLSGRVTDSSGAPIAGAAVSAVDEDGFAVPKTKTDERGVYALNLEGDLEYRVTATCPGRRPATRTEFVPLAESLPLSADGQAVVWGTVGVGNLAGVDFALEAADDPLSDVHRFYSKGYKGHFFTIDEDEAETVRTTNPNWRYEGVAYRASVAPGEGLVPLYRFWSKGYRSHFYTTSEEERDSVIATNPNWKYETVAYWVSPEPVEGTVPVYRFWSSGYKHHFYTIDEDEKNTLIATNPNWKYEMIAFYAWP